MIMSPNPSILMFFWHMSKRYYGEFDLLYTLARSANQVLSTDEIVTRVWGAEFIGQPQVVYVHMRWLREKLEENPNRPKHILTVRGVGYKYVPEESL